MATYRTSCSTRRGPDRSSGPCREANATGSSSPPSSPTRPTLLALDEPTNDLDTETLEVLESTLVEFSGTVLVVSHDRTFLDNVVTSTIAFDANHPREYVGGYTDYIRQTQPTEEPGALASATSSVP